MILTQDYFKLLLKYNVNNDDHVSKNTHYHRDIRCRETFFSMIGELG